LRGVDWKPEPSYWSRALDGSSSLPADHRDGGELRKARGARIGALGRIPIDLMGNAVIANLETTMVLVDGLGPRICTDCGFEPVSAGAQPVSGRLALPISDIEKSSSRDSRQKSRPSVRDVRYSSPETGPFTANPRECRHSSEHRNWQARDHCGWLGHEDSNLGMAKSKSAAFERARSKEHRCPASAMAYG
jgi:hypothetical protein